MEKLFQRHHVSKPGDLDAIFFAFLDTALRRMCNGFEDSMFETEYMLFHIKKKHAISHYPISINRKYFIMTFCRIKMKQ